MTIERYVESIPQTTDAIPKVLPLERPSGNFLVLISATAAISVTLINDGVREVFANITGGLYVKRIVPWKNLRIEGVIGTAITYLYGSMNVDKDDTDVRLQIATIAGTTGTADVPATTITDAVNVAVPNAAQTAIFPGNGTRRRINFSFASNAAIGANTVFARKAGGVNNLYEIQAGVSYGDAIIGGMDIRNDSGGALTALIYEVS